MKGISLLKLYLIFVKIGAILLGGGYVIMPIITEELCKKRKLLKEEDVVNYFAISQSLPGIIATNISMFAGYKLRGKLGAIIAMLGIITIPFITIVLLASVLDKFTNNTFVQGLFWGVGIAVIALLFLTVREIWQKSKRDLFFYFIFLFALIALLIFKFTPIQTILIFAFIGVACRRLASKKIKKINKEDKQ